MTDNFDWLEQEAAPPGPRPKKRAQKKTARKKVSAAKATRAPTVEEAVAKIESQSKMTKAARRGRVMFQAVAGRKRIWACDGEYVFFRRKSCIDPARPGEVHRAITRHENFLARGDYTYLETQDDVEICKVNPQSPFARKGMFLGEMNDGAVRRQIAIAACKRDWVLYADALEEYAGRIKGRWLQKGTAGQAQTAWNEELGYIDNLIQMRGGPTQHECGVQLQNIRLKRGAERGRMILLPS